MKTEKLLIKATLLASLLAFILLVEPPLQKQSQIKPRNIDLSNLTGEYTTNKKLAFFHGRDFDVPEPTVTRVLGYKEVRGTKDKKRIEIDLTNQKLYAYEGNKKIFEFLVSTGKWGKTPTGEFRIWTKLKYTLMTGGSQALGTYYYLPNVPFTMYFYNAAIPKHRGYGIHGTYWHNNFGHPMSHGCINMKTEEAEKLFYWANPVLAENQWSVNASAENTGTRVIIYGEAPDS